MPLLTKPEAVPQVVTTCTPTTVTPPGGGMVKAVWAWAGARPKQRSNPSASQSFFMVKSSIRTDTDDIVDGGGYINRHGDCSSRDGVGRLDCGTLRSDDAGRSGGVGYAEGDGASS